MSRNLPAREGLQLYPDVSLFIDGSWTKGSGTRPRDIFDPSTGEVIGQVPCAEQADLEKAVIAADRAFRSWSAVSTYDRGKILRKAADLLRTRMDDIVRVLSIEEGKPLGEAKLELFATIDLIDWFAEEGRRAYGRVIPARTAGIYQLVVKEPIGPVAAFSPWNFPVNQAVRKIAAALAAGCSIIVKGPEETPASCAMMVAAFAEAGTPAGVLNLVYGVPAEISGYLIPHPLIRKVSFTGSVAVGRQLAALAGQHMKRNTMELGGHAPAIVFGDADIDSAIKFLGGAKFRNAGQICASPTRFMIQDAVYDRFLEQFVELARKVKVGSGLDPETVMGPVATARRLEAVESLVADAVAKGAEVKTGGHRIGNKGYFFEPTVLTGVPTSALIMNEEPFGPIAPISRFSDLEEAIAEANRLPYGLAAYAYTSSTKTASAIAARVESGMVSINHQGLALPETPFGGVKDSGYGSEQGIEGLDAYLTTKFVTQLGI
jgi:succinate-semialdehyde dehydrogenase/glutarate-semialdehyde dehydrogenase